NHIRFNKQNCQPNSVHFRARILSVFPCYTDFCSVAMEQNSVGHGTTAAVRKQDFFFFCAIL
ncbi:MAG: hypothetical protein MJZ69_08490, partial [Bacteroidaceae bacterium]|nr:hypothetical protein [Bacteroidaceae bacterium]